MKRCYTAPSATEEQHRSKNWCCKNTSKKLLDTDAIVPTGVEFEASRGLEVPAISTCFASIRF